MPTSITPLATLLYLCACQTTAEDMLAPLCSPQSSKPFVNSFQQKRVPPAYVFGKTAAQSVEDAIAQGFVKNENPQKPGTPLLTCLEVGSCVAVPRNDATLTFGVVTEIISPTIVCVACDNSSRSEDDMAVKVVHSSQLFLNPYWLTHSFKDGSTLAHYTQIVRPSAPTPPETV